MGMVVKSYFVIIFLLFSFYIETVLLTRWSVTFENISQ
ncbi:hypothetical protein P7266_1551 [Lactococcus cremoris]|nr:hypothetical protein P7266_1551 [Lactococcus cremoris]